MEIQEVELKVKEFLIEELEIEEDAIYPDAKLKEDMNIGSLELVDVVVFVENEFGFKIEPQEFKKIITFSQFCEYLWKRVQSK